MTNKQIVLNFIKAVEANDKGRILSFFNEDAFYHNIPLEPCVGLDEIWTELAQVHDIATDVDWIVHNIAEGEDGKVYTERTDRYYLNGKWAEFRVMGIFELK
ncbi:MAG: nuclear transport factor 2 family protein, partial [Deltaproteobacteria bacterium]|nr:nuclear transport factor 2 family protein [Deltaproteobacteria bacterium]